MKNEKIKAVLLRLPQHENAWLERSAREHMVSKNAVVLRCIREVMANEVAKIT